MVDRSGPARSGTKQTLIHRLFWSRRPLGRGKKGKPSREVSSPAWCLVQDQWRDPTWLISAPIIAVAAIGIAVICISAYLLGTRQRPPRVVLSEPTPPSNPCRAQIEESTRPSTSNNEELLTDLHL